MKRISLKTVREIVEKYQDGEEIEKIAHEHAVGEDLIYKWVVAFQDVELGKLSLADVNEVSKSTNLFRVFDKGWFTSDTLNNGAITLFRVLTLSLGVIAIIAEIFSPDTFSFLSYKTVTAAVLFVQAIFAISIVVIGNPIPASWNRQEKIDLFVNSDYFKGIKITIKEFTDLIKSLQTDFSRSWIYLWVSWALLYVWLFALKMYQLKSGSNCIDCWQAHVFDLISNTINLCGTYFLYRLYLSVRYRSTQNDSYQKEKSQTIFSTLVFALFFCELVLIIIIGYSNSNLIYSQAIIFKSAVVGADFTIKDLHDLFEITNSLLAGVVLAMFIGRLLDSYAIKFRYKPWVLPGLYCYGTLQAFFPYLSLGSLSQFIALLVIFLALFFKYLLYYVTTSIIKLGIILFYGIETREFMSKIDVSLIKFKEAYKKIDEFND